QTCRAAELESLIAQSPVADGAIAELRADQQRLSSELEAARSAWVKYEAVAAFRDRYDRLVTEGKDKKAVLEKLNARISRLKRVDGELVEVNTRLAALDDPRGRSLGPKVSVAREDELNGELEKSGLLRRSIDDAVVVLETQIEAYSGLDAEIAAQREL